MVKPQSITGFPEYTPELQLAAQAMLGQIRHQFELYGFVPIETPAVERLEVLLAKGGDTDKEMYILNRLQPEENESSEAKLGLHYDLTVPFARYVAQHFGSLVFPFKRYQIQYCWRGERPQEGRFRQFLQCDLDVVAVDQLPLSFDAEIPLVAYEVLQSMGIGQFAVRISNRKILEGYLQGLGLAESVVGVTRVLDKLEKIGRAKVLEALGQLGVADDVAPRCLEIAAINTTDLSFAEKVRGLGVESPGMEQGLEELTKVMEPLIEAHPEGCVADLSVTRGLDYYTGTVYEIRWTDFPKLGSIGAGGRYDDLASNFTRQRLPGVGLSLGFSRIFNKLVSEGRVQPLSRCPTRVLVTWLDESPAKSRAAARLLRSRGIAAEAYHEPAKLTKQLNYANKKGIPYVFFETDAQIKNMQSGEQLPVDLSSWKPGE